MEGRGELKERGKARCYMRIPARVVQDMGLRCAVETRIALVCGLKSGWRRESTGELCSR